MTHSTIAKDSQILIIGAGTWGTAISYRLSRRGYKKIKVLDSHDFPSSTAAGNDINKILEEPLSPPSEHDNDEEYAWNTIETLATEVWRTDPIYRPYYHETGFIYAAVGNEAFEKVTDSVNGHEDVYTPLKNAEDFRKTMPNGVLTGDFPGWRGFWRKKRAGWVAARKTMEDVCAEARKLGVEFVTGEEKGRVQALLFDGERRDVVGVRTADGIEHFADCTILAAGAGSDSLLDFKKQLRPTAWTLAHIPLNEVEVELFRGLPVLYGVDRGFFIEPDVDNMEMKICDEHPGYINLVADANTGDKRSVPFARQQIPIEAEQRMRTLLKETMPQLVERPFSFARICWDADTVNRLFLIDRHPEYRSLVLAVGGSGHGFMCSPAVGIMVADILENRSDERLSKMLQWRPETALDRDWYASQGRYGSDGKVMEFHEVRKWTDIEIDA